MELERHYATQREPISARKKNELVAAMVAEDARMHGARPHCMGMAAFVASEVRYVPAWTWVAQVALVVLMCAMAHTADSIGTTKIAIGMLSAMSVLVGVSPVQASKLHRVVELEYACPYNASSVMIARLIVLGCSSALAVAFMVGITASMANASAFDVALWACPPFFLSCAGSLMALRKAHPATATTLCAAWTASCSVTLLALANALPNLYANTSVATWATAAAMALVWLVREVTMTFRAVSAGLDAFSPQWAKTHN